MAVRLLWRWIWFSSDPHRRLSCACTRLRLESHAEGLQAPFMKVASLTASSGTDEFSPTVRR